MADGAQSCYAGSWINSKQNVMNEETCAPAGVALGETGFGYTLSLIGGKYKMLILYALAANKVLRHNELKRHLGGIAFKTLSVVLKELEADALIVRKEAKGHGTGAWLEGPLPPAGSLVTVLEDVVTSGGSALKAVNQLREAGYRVQRVVTIVDREEGGAAAFAAAGLELCALLQLAEVAAAAP